jgi:hypothetical protein
MFRGDGASMVLQKGYGLFYFIFQRELALDTLVIDLINL